MLITMLADRFDAGGVLRAKGTQVDVATDLAMRWIGDGVAAPVGNSRETGQGIRKEVPVTQDQISGQQFAGPAPVSGAGAPVLDAGTAGSSSGWIAYTPGMRLAYALDSGSASTTFSVDISADGATSIGQAFTGTWASTTAEISPPIWLTNPQARYIRFNVLSGGPLSVIRF